MPGPLMRSRHTAAMLQLMGIHETLASTVDDYAAIAAQLANDPAWRQAIRDRVATEKIRLFRDREAVLALENFLDRAVRNGSEDPVTIR
jgi:protein O-GlcNAc transferase